MHTDNPEENMTFGELLALIADQQRRLTVLENAFAFLSFCLDEKACQLLIHSLRLESQNQNRDTTLQQHFSHLADALEKRNSFNPPPADIS
ncbi:hypothetical protein BL250_02810 [Erwinia sp. OLTSP20]|uniref:hypothetical protein n=1 Tax=unclassified Erwinia TaxID=2622719 RepID=UPI000C1A2EA2|nr:MULTISPECIES: hypothetical protein [unclassified Erwinia]PIJ51992.1 hypothetical protein BV501_01710 [Erwinia sp. OAMSP11]PIJ74866.1 hypothetical protein BK416_03045 [Erwinia sp. OLSSP12]PIJ85233.1 hypothetical protein BLD47_00785 [Erwinia sp. OLCASP19]PIJ87234.1 hypothetical protein BLD46_01180 [Erwinia sp. OLMTSP26]PIJ88397.1 hypothetical protein BLD49_02235 [Erwinia sp. OLMDSP33]